MILKAPCIFINGRRISNEEPPFIIAELSANHNGNIERAFKIIEQAKNSRADAVKLQTYHPDTMTIDCGQDDFLIKGGLWDGRTLYELYQEAHMPWDWHEPLFKHAHKHGITIFSSPFDRTAVDLLEDLNAPAYKIASFELIDLPLIKYVASTGKPMILSTGMADAREIQEAIETAREGGCKEMAILHCVSGYPAPAGDYNLRIIPDMAQRFDLVIGLSDHTMGNTTAIASIAMGASIIEKHFTLDRNSGGPDDSFSLEPEELKRLCEDSKVAWESLGKVSYERKKSEKGNVLFRRSLYVIKDIKAGETITNENVKSIRPGFGMPPKFFGQIMGRVTLRDIDRGTPLSMKDLK
jgi:pseudaminic acid synthase